MDLRYAITCEPSGDKDIRLRTPQKTIKLSAESTPNRDEWMRAIRKVMFKAQNMEDSVKVRVTPHPITLSRYHTRGASMKRN